MSLMNEHSFNLITTGLSLGLLHVLAGPDHLSALAALSVGSSWRAFTLGFRWGIGHSTGLVVVAIIFISLKGELDLRTMGRYCDLLVGLFMIALGCYGVLGAIKMYREKHNKRDRDLVDSTGSKEGTHSGKSAVETPKAVLSASMAKTASHTDFSFIVTATDRELSRGHSHGEDDEESQLIEQNSEHNFNNSTHSDSAEDINNIIATRQPNINSNSNLLNGDAVTLDSMFSHHHHHDIVAEDCPWCPFIDMHDPYTQRIVSFAIGLLHGVAGPGGILGVLPAVEMQNYTSSFLYLTSFIVASTLSMGTFAALYGELTKRIGATAESVELALNIFSSAMSIIVGTVWFVLSLLGKLEGLFH